MIQQGTWRIRLVYYEEGRFEPSGYLHPTCSGEYFGTSNVLDRLIHFTVGLSADDLAEVKEALNPAAPS